MKYFKNIYFGKKVLVTGHTGFKGSWISLWLKELGAEVAGYSCDVPTSPSHFSLLSLEKEIIHKVGDVCDKEALSDFVDEFQPDIIFHLAAQALVRESYQDPIRTYMSNTLGTLNMLEVIRERPRIEAAVFITSDKAYRNDEWCWGYRETDVLAGGDPYSNSKSCADLIVQSHIQSYFRFGSTKISIARAGNVIGGGDWASNRIIPDCIRAWKNGGSVEIRSPHSTRPWQHVLEPLSGYLDLGAMLLSGKNTVNFEAFNFGPDAEVNATVLELLEGIKKHWKDVKWSIPNSAETNQHEATLLKLSCDKALHYLKWSPVLKLEETIRFTVDWYKGWMLNPADTMDISLNQIRDYCNLATERGLSWTK